MLAGHLVSGGCLSVSSRRKAVEIIKDFMKVFIPLDYDEDLKCLNESILHHTTAYIKTTMVIEARTHVLKSGDLSTRSLHDKDIKKGAKDVTKEVLNEIGDIYRQRLYLYFGDEEGLVSFVYHRVYDAMYDFSRDWNQKVIMKFRSGKFAAESVATEGGGT